MADETYTKSDLDKAIAEAVGKVEESLKGKNSELLDEVKKLKSDLRKTQDIKPEDVAALESEIDGLKTKLGTAEKAAKDATAAREKAEKALESESGFNRKLVVENGLREALAANGVTNPVHQKAAIALLGTGVQVATEGDVRVAKVGDKGLADFVKEWAGGDEGKHFVSAPNNSGGGAGGGHGKTQTGKTVTRSAFDGMAPADQMAFSKEGGTVVDA